jgi:hypothetical protein
MAKEPDARWSPDGGAIDAQRAEAMRWPVDEFDLAPGWPNAMRGSMLACIRPAGSRDRDAASADRRREALRRLCRERQALPNRNGHRRRVAMLEERSELLAMRVLMDERHARAQAVAEALPGAVAALRAATRAIRLAADRDYDDGLLVIGRGGIHAAIEGAHALARALAPLRLVSVDIDGAPRQFGTLAEGWEWSPHPFSVYDPAALQWTARADIALAAVHARLQSLVQADAIGRMAMLSPVELEDLAVAADDLANIIERAAGTGQAAAPPPRPAEPLSDSPAASRSGAAPMLLGLVSDMAGRPDTDAAQALRTSGRVASKLLFDHDGQRGEIQARCGEGCARRAFTELRDRAGVKGSHTLDRDQIRMIAEAAEADDRLQIGAALRALLLDSE